MLAVSVGNGAKNPAGNPLRSRYLCIPAHGKHVCEAPTLGQCMGKNELSAPRAPDAHGKGGKVPAMLMIFYVEWGGIG